MAKKKLTNEDANRLSVELGYFFALHKMLKSTTSRRSFARG
jgi:hypothetical protein